MSIAKDGRAIIGGHIVPPMEVRVLRALAEREEPIRAPDLTVLLSKSEGVRGAKVTVASVYAWLNRLRSKILVQREENFLRILETGRVFVFWNTTEVVKKFFRELEDS